MVRAVDSFGWLFRLSLGVFAVASGVVFNTGWGATWSEIDAGLPSTAVNIRAIAVAPRTPATIYASAISADGSGRLYKTTNGAANWRAVSSIVGVSSVFVDPQN